MKPAKILNNTRGPIYAELMGERIALRTKEGKLTKKQKQRLADLDEFLIREFPPQESAYTRKLLREIRNALRKPPCAP